MQVAEKGRFQLIVTFQVDYNLEIWITISKSGLQSRNLDYNLEIWITISKWLATNSQENL